MCAHAGAHDFWLIRCVFYSPNSLNQNSLSFILILAVSANQKIQCLWCESRVDNDALHGRRFFPIEHSRILKWTAKEMKRELWQSHSCHINHITYRRSPIKLVNSMVHADECQVLRAANGCLYGCVKKEFKYCRTRCNMDVLECVYEHYVFGIN